MAHEERRWPPYQAVRAQPWSSRRPLKWIFPLAALIITTHSFNNFRHPALVNSPVLCIIITTQRAAHQAALPSPPNHLALDEHGPDVGTAGGRGHKLPADDHGAQGRVKACWIKNMYLAFRQRPPRCRSSRSGGGAAHIRGGSAASLRG